MTSQGISQIKPAATTVTEKETDTNTRIGPETIETGLEIGKRASETDGSGETDPSTNWQNASRPFSTVVPGPERLVTFDDLVPGEITVDSALLFVGDQILYRYKDEKQAWRLKFISPASVRAAFDELPIDSGWLPSAVQRHGLHPKGDWAMMFIPPGRHAITLEISDQTFDLTIPLPGLIFAGCGVNYYLYALKSAEFSPEAPLFYAPLSNINGNGLICFGSNPMLPCSVTCISQMWQVFIASAFTAHHMDHRCQSYPDNIFLLLHSLVGKRKFPARELLPAHMNGNQWIDRLIRHNTL